MKIHNWTSTNLPKQGHIWIVEREYGELRDIHAPPSLLSSILNHLQNQAVVQVFLYILLSETSIPIMFPVGSQGSISYYNWERGKRIMDNKRFTKNIKLVKKSSKSFVKILPNNNTIGLPSNSIDFFYRYLIYFIIYIKARQIHSVRIDDVN